VRGPAIGAIALSVLVGCGDNTVDDGNGVRSGSRLRAKYIVSGDARRFEGFHDSARDEDCSFSLGQGQTIARCLPDSTLANGFMDAQCAVPAFYRSATGCDTPTPYVALPYEGCGGGVARLWKVGTLQRPALIYGRDGVGNCVASVPGADRVWYAAVEEVPLDAFVAAELREDDDVHGRLKPRYLHGTDGSRFDLSPFDSELGVTCDISNWYEQLVCQPRVSEGGWLWTDATCTTSLVEADLGQFPACAGPVPPYAAIWRSPEPNTCHYTREIYRMGDEVASTSLYYGMAGTCRPDTNGEREVHALGEQIPFDALPPVERLQLGSGRIRTNVLESGGLRRRAEYEFIDTLRGTRCSPFLARDGKERCLPDLGYLGEYFITPNCIGRRSFVNVWDSCGTPFPEEIFALDYTDPVVACGRGNYGVMSAGAEVVQGTVYQLNDANACVPVMWDRAQMRIYELGAEILPREFAEFEHVVE
jgi:hypothetical protein